LQYEIEPDAFSTQKKSLSIAHSATESPLLFI
jgi:hypothetical protein